MTPAAPRLEVRLQLPGHCQGDRRHRQMSPGIDELHLAGQRGCEASGLERVSTAAPTRGVLASIASEGGGEWRVLLLWVLVEGAGHQRVCVHLVEVDQLHRVAKAHCGAWSEGDGDPVGIQWQRQQRWRHSRLEQAGWAG